jgi:hypothetical protein
MLLVPPNDRPGALLFPSEELGELILVRIEEARLHGLEQGEGDAEEKGVAFEDKDVEDAGGAVEREVVGVDGADPRVEVEGGPDVVGDEVVVDLASSQRFAWEKSRRTAGIWSAKRVPKIRSYASI